MPRIAFFDIETRKGPKTLSPKDEQAGWEMLRRGEGGISSLCLYDTQFRWLYMYDDTRKSLATAARHLEAVDCVVGYCSEMFDVPCAEGILGRALRLRLHYDIYVEIARGCASRGITTTAGDLKLETICRKNLGRGKIEHGSHAEQLLADGRVAEVFNYCGDDVHLTHDLFRFICLHGGVHLNGHGWLPLTVPDWIKAWAEE